MPWYTRVLEIRPSFWFGPQVFVAYANKNVVIIFEFQTDNRVCVKSSKFWLICQCSMRPKQWNSGAEPRVRRTLPRCNNHLLINSWFLSEYMMKFNYIFHKYKTELFWFDGIIFVPLVRTEILHFSGISLGGRTLGTPVSPCFAGSAATAMRVTVSDTLVMFCELKHRNIG